MSEEEEEEEDERLKKEREQFQSLIQMSQKKEKPRSRKKVVKDEYEEDEEEEDESEGQSYDEDDFEPGSKQQKFEVKELFQEQDGERDFIRKFKQMKGDDCFKGSLWRYGEEDDAFFLPGHGFGLTKDKYDKLFDHQKEGVQWLYGLYRNKLGGVLADDMGLGKTV